MLVTALYWTLTTAAIGAAVLRLSFLSVAYLLSTLVAWHFRPTAIVTLRLCVTLVTLSSLACLAHIVFQIVIASDHDKYHTLRRQHLTSYGVSVLGEPAETSVRLVLPDVALLIISAISLHLLRKKQGSLQPSPSEGENTALLTRQDDKRDDSASDRLLKQQQEHQKTGERAVYLMSLILLCFSPPSVPTALYLLATCHILLTIALKADSTTHVLVSKAVIAMATLLHIVALFLFQLPEVHKSTSRDAGQLFGLYPLMKSRGELAPRALVAEMTSWSVWILPLSLLACYYVSVHAQ